MDRVLKAAMGAVLMTSFLPSSSEAQRRGPDDGAVEAYYRTVGQAFSVSLEEVRILGEWQLPPEEITVVLFVARRAGVSPDAIATQRDAGAPWTTITQRYGVGAGVFRISFAPGTSLGPLEGAYRSFTETPRASWDTLLIDDQVLVALVNIVSCRTSSACPPRRCSLRGSVPPTWSSYTNNSRVAEPMTDPRFIPLPSYTRLPEDEMKARAEGFRAELQRRRTVRHFSDQPVPRDVIEDCLLAAGTAPNGANKQPWHFVVVGDPGIKRQIREAAEEEERAFYSGRAGAEWLDVLEHLGTDADKPFLERAPYLIVILAESYEMGEDGEKSKNYYVTESVGIATGMLITAVHRAGLVSLTHTPSPMGFLNEIIGRPKNERAFLILVVGYPEEDARVPDISKKSIDQIATFVE